MKLEERIHLIQREMRSIAESAGAVHCHPAYTHYTLTDIVDFQYVSYGRLMAAVAFPVKEVMMSKIEDIAHKLQVEFMKQMARFHVESEEKAV